MWQRITYGAGASVAALAILIGVAPAQTNAFNRQQATVFTVENARITLPDDGGYVDILGGTYGCGRWHVLALEGRQSMAKPLGKALTVGPGWRFGQRQFFNNDPTFKFVFGNVPGASDNAFNVEVKLQAWGKLLGSTTITVPGCTAPAAGGAQTLSATAVCPASATSAVVVLGDKAYGYYGAGDASLAVYQLPAGATAGSSWAQRTPQTRFGLANGGAGTCIEVPVPSNGKIQVDLLKGTVTPPAVLTDSDMGPMVRSIAFISRDGLGFNAAVIAPGINI